MYLFGGHVKWRADKAVSLHRQGLIGPVALEQLRQTEVKYLHLSPRSNHYVARLEVTMNYALFMGLLKCFGNLQENRGSIFHRQRSRLYLRRKGFSRNAFHHDIVDAVLFTDVVHCRNMSVAQ